MTDWFEGDGPRSPRLVAVARKLGS
jgi:hypothetical protein